jgi:putative sigma-54 modulation protein
VAIVIRKGYAIIVSNQPLLPDVIREVEKMRVIITSKNVNASDHLKETIEKKLEKLGKYFSDDIGVNVMLSAEKNRQKIEATIQVRGMIFRAEETTADLYDGVDRVSEKLATQMSRFKTKIQRKHKDNREFSFPDWPESDTSDELKGVKKKKFELNPMTVDEAIVQMEMLEHTFFVFLNTETDSVNVVYRREDQDYGLLEPVY